MSILKRVISKLEIKGSNLVKGIQFEGIRALGPPELFAMQYYADGIDELVYYDLVASLYGRNSLHKVVSTIADEIHIPMTVGGGLRSVDDIENVLKSGADKVALNTAAVANPKLIEEGAKAFGAQCIVVNIDSKRIGPGEYEVYVDGGREPTGRNVFEWAREAVDRGAGELLVTAIDKDGTRKGMDLSLIRTVTDSVSVPVIPAGGIGSADHAVEAVVEAHADAVCLSSLLHYNYLDVLDFSVCDVNKQDGSVDFINWLREGKCKIDQSGLFIPELKKHMAENGVCVRGVL